MTDRQRLITVTLSVLLVPLWASGFVVGKLATMHAAVAPVLFWRFLIAGTLMGVLAWLGHARRPRGLDWLHLTAVALLMQIGQFVGAYTGLARGVPAGVSSLVMGMAPLLVALLAPLWFPERLTVRIALGLLLGAVGVSIVLSGDLHGMGSTAPLGFTLVGMVSMTAGTLYQKRFGGDVDVRTALAVQMSIAAAVMGGFMLTSHGAVTPDDRVGWFAVGWLGIANSAGAFAVMYLLLRRVSTVHVSSLLNLVPATTALASVPILGEALSARYLIGLAVAVVGMYLGIAARLRRRTSQAEAAPPKPSRDAAAATRSDQARTAVLCEHSNG